MPEDAQERSDGSGASRRSALRARLASIPAGVRAAAVTAATMAGWASVAFWLAATRTHFEGDEGGGVWWLMVTCGCVGTVQALFVLSQKSASGRTWRSVLGPLGLVLVHIGVVFALVEVIVPAPHRFDAGADVLVLGFFGWILGPLLLMVALGAALMALGLGREGVRSFSKARSSHVAGGPGRPELLSRGIALFGCAGLVVFWALGVPGSGGAMHGIGSAMVFAAELLLQAVHVHQGPMGWFFRVDRIGYLVSVIAIAQFAPFAVVAAVRSRRRGGEGSDGVGSPHPGTD